MKTERQAAIRELLKEREIHTQEELAAALREMDYKVTQATVSRDIREMHLLKVPGQDGGYHYEAPDTDDMLLDERQARLLRDCVVSIEAAGQMIVAKTMSGAAGTAAEALDTLEMPEIVGTIAGDNTILLVARDHLSAVSAVERIQSLIG